MQVDSAGHRGYIPAHFLEVPVSLMVSISGIRGVVGTTLTPEVVVKYAAAYSEYCEHGPIAVGRDGRISGPPIVDLVSGALRQMGSDVIDLGIVPTPTVALAVERLGLAGGISVTASHNPMIWNGLKFFSRTGLFLNADENKAFWAIADQRRLEYRSWDRLGQRTDRRDVRNMHVRAVLDMPVLRPEIIRKRRLRVVVDCVNASGGTVVPELLRDLGCDVIELYCDVSGVFAHTPEPIPENLSDLSSRVKAEKADVGLAIDPDADRLVVIDERGEPIGEEYTVTTAVDLVLRREQERGASGHTVVVNLSTTRAVEDVAKRYGASCLRTPVGEINVAKRMLESGSVIGGEGSGGVIYPAVHAGRDALVGVGLVLQALAEHDGPTSSWRASLPQYAISKGKVDVGSLDARQRLTRIAAEVGPSGRINTDDGLKIDLPDSWIHLRLSNTEPIIRIIAEAPDREQADQLVRRYTEQILR
jgi:phosphomannomutase